MRRPDHGGEGGAPATGATEIEVPLFESSPANRRQEDREEVVRSVEFCRFPRVCADTRLRRGFTRNLSTGGLCLRVEQAEPVGALLRLAVRGIDGEAGEPVLGRVAWTRPSRDSEGGHWLGIAVLEASGQAPVRLRLRRTREA